MNVKQVKDVIYIYIYCIDHMSSMLKCCLEKYA